MPVETNTVPQTKTPDLLVRSLAVQPLPKPLRPFVPVPHRKRNLFSETLLEASSTRHPRRGLQLLFSIGLHILVLLALVLPPLYFADTLDLRHFTQTLLVAPPPPPPPPAAQAVVKSNAAPRHMLLSGGKLIAPTAVPSRIVMLKEEPLPPEIGNGVADGVPGGVPGGQLGGVIGGVISDASRTNLPTPVSATRQPKIPIRVGGRVRPPRVLLKPSPVYPPLAKQTRIQGTVSIDAVIDTEGNVVEMSVVSGHPLLISAALDAVKNWKYAPTYLNDQAVAVQLMVTVRFQLEH